MTDYYLAILGNTDIALHQVAAPVYCILESWKSVLKPLARPTSVSRQDLIGLVGVHLK